MKKTIRLLLVVSLILVQLAGCGGKSDKSGKGEIEKASETEKKSEWLLVKESEYTINVLEDGSLTEMGNPGIVYVYEYDENGKLFTKKRVDVKDNHLISGTKYDYDEKGRLLTETYIYNDGTYGDVDDRYFYDEQGRLIKSGELNSQGISVGCSESVAYYEYTYDENDRLIAKVGYDGFGRVHERNAYEYDAKGLLCKGEYQGDRNSWTRTYEYDENGRLIKATEPLKNQFGEERNLDEVHDYAYDTGGLLIEVNALCYDFLHSGDECYDWIDKYEYDENGNMTVHIFRKNSYDTQWIHCITYEYEHR